MTEAEAIKLIWDYHQLHHSLKPADAFFVFCSNDTRVAAYAATLWPKKLAPIVIVSGDGTNHHSALLRDTHAGQTEAEVFAEIMIAAGIPEEKIVLEKKANNTAENFSFSKKIAETSSFKIDSAIIIQKPYMERRTFATGKIVWPELNQTLTSPALNFDEYCDGSIDRKTVINLMVGDLQRIKEYPKRGFQIKQDIPTEVWRAYEFLVAAGYEKHLL